MNHAAGCLVGFAAREGIEDFDSVLGLLKSAIQLYWAGHDFAQPYKVERIKLGFNDGQQGGAQ